MDKNEGEEEKRERNEETYRAWLGMMYRHKWRHDVSAEVDMMYAPRIRLAEASRGGLYLRPIDGGEEKRMRNEEWWWALLALDRWWGAEKTSRGLE